MKGHSSGNQQTAIVIQLLSHPRWLSQALPARCHQDYNREQCVGSVNACARYAEVVSWFSFGPNVEKCGTTTDLIDFFLASAVMRPVPRKAANMPIYLPSECPHSQVTPRISILIVIII